MDIAYHFPGRFNSASITGQRRSRDKVQQTTWSFIIGFNRIDPYAGELAGELYRGS